MNKKGHLEPAIKGCGFTPGIMQIKYRIVPATSIEQDAVLWKEYLKAVEKLNEPIRKQYLAESKKEVALLELWEARCKQLRKAHNKKRIDWEKKSIIHKLFNESPLLFHYETPMSFLPYPTFSAFYILTACRKATYEDFLTWLANGKKFTS